MAVPDGGALGDVLAPRPDHLDDLLLEQLSQQPEPDTDAQGQQPLLRRPHQLTERLLHPRRQRQFLGSDLSQRYRPHGGSSCLSTTSRPRHGRHATGRDGRTATSTFYDSRDNLSFRCTAISATALLATMAAAGTSRGSESSLSADAAAESRRSSLPAIRPATE